MLILITGASGSGKSTISINLSKMINAIIIPQDSFYTIPYDNAPFDNCVNDDVEGEGLIDWDKLCKTVVKIQATCKDVNIIVEGHCVFTSDILLELADALIYIEEHKNIIKRRFMNRYADSYTNEQLESKNRYFEEKTWPAHEKYVERVVKNVCMTDPEKYLKISSDIIKGTDRIIDFIKCISLN